MKYFIVCFFFFVFPTSFASASNFMSLHYDVDQAKINQRFVVFVDVNIKPQDSNTEIYLESLLGNEQLKIVKFGDNQFAAVIPPISEGGKYVWTVKGYFQNSEYAKNYSIHVLYLENRVNELEELIQTETDLVKKNLLIVSVQKVNDEITYLRNSMLAHRQHFETSSVDIQITGEGLSILNGNIPELTLENYQYAGTYGDKITYDFSISDVIGGPYKYILTPKVNDYAQSTLTVDTREFSVPLLQGNLKIGDNFFSMGFSYVNVFSLESIDQSLASLEGKRINFVLLKNSSIDPYLKDFYQKEIDDLSILNVYFLQHRQKLHKQGEATGSYFYLLKVGSPPKISTGSNFTCGVFRSAVYCWGVNGKRQLGLPNNTNQLLPTVPVTSLGENVHMLSSGSLHACAVKGRDLYCWGDNTYGQLGIGLISSEAAPSKALLAAEITDVSAGVNHTCAVSNSRLFCWGSNQYGQLARDHSGGGGWPGLVNLSDVKSVASGDGFTCALNKNGRVFCWGKNNVGQAASSNGETVFVPTDIGLSDIVKISAGSLNACALNTTGAVYCWGGNSFLQLGDYFQGAFSSSPIDIAGFEFLTTNVSVGNGTICSVHNGQVKCLGRGANGSLGNASYPNTNVKYPVNVTLPGTSSINAIAMGNVFGCAIVGQSPYCWGANYGGNIGNGKASGQHALTPALVSVPQNFE